MGKIAYPKVLGGREWSGLSGNRIWKGVPLLRETLGTVLIR